MIWHLMAIVLIRTNVFISHLRPLTLRHESALPIKEREKSQGKGYRGSYTVSEYCPKSLFFKADT